MGTIPTPVPSTDARAVYWRHMVTRHTRNGITWVDLECPNRDELREVMEEFDIGARVEEEIVSPTPYPLVLSCPSYVYLILHFPTANPQGGARSQEIDFIVGKKFVITARYEAVDSINSLQRLFETEELLNLPSHGTTAAPIVERVLRHIYGAIREQAEITARQTERIEENIFSGHEREMVLAISLVGRVLLRFHTALSRHEEPLKAFLQDLSAPGFFGKEFAAHAPHIQAEHDHTVAVVDSFRAVVHELRTTNESLLSASQNEIITRLTVITVLVLPLSVFTGFFGMNNEYLPFVNSPGFPYFSLAFMVTAVGLILLYFKARKWF